MSENTLILTIRKPTATRRSFSIVRDERTSNSRLQTTWDCQEIKNINKLFKSGSIGIDQALQMVMDLKEKELVKFYGPRQDLKFSSVNKKIVDKHLQTVQSRRLDKVTKRNIEIDCLRILRMLGENSLLSVPRDVLIERINSLTSKHGKVFAFATREKILVRLNILLKEVNRGDKDKDLLILEDLNPDESDEDSGVVSYISEKDLPLLLKQAELCEDPQIVKDCITILFYSGMREGELFAMDAGNWMREGGHYIVKKQRDREWKLKDPKGSTKKRGPKIRNVLVPPQAMDAFERWCNYDKQKLKDLRLKLSVRVKQAAKKAWPNEPLKHVSNHDLRHSAAVNYLSKGFSLTATAGRLGHSEKVCRDYYAGWITSDEEVGILNSKLSG